MAVVSYLVAAVVIYVITSWLLTPRARRPRYSGATALANSTEGESAIIRHPAAPQSLTAVFDPEVRTLYENFRKSVRLHGDRDCLGHRVNGGPFVWLTYKEVARRADNFASGLVNSFGLRPGVADGKEPTFIGIFSQNRMEWFIAENACYAMGWVVVPLYDTLGSEAVEHIINQTNLSTIVCAKEKLPQLLALIKESKCGSLRFVVQMEKEVDPAQREIITSAGHLISSFEQIEYAGAEKPVAHAPPAPGDLFTLCYTSGTTGLPKGAMLTHGQMVAVIAGISTAINLREDDVYISYLPLAHVYERLMEHVLFSSGCSIGLFRGDVLKLFDDIANLRPTLFPSVPRLFNRLYDKVQAGLSAKPMARLLFDFAYSKKKANLAKGHLTHWLWDRVVFSKIRQTLGGRVRLMTSGSAPLSNEVMEFLRISFSCPVVEGYGQTENNGAAFATLIDDLSTGHVGCPLTSFEMKLVDVAEMNYRTTDKPHPRGEVCLRGPAVFSGYYRMPEKTNEALDKDGWLHTGDVGMLLSNNYLRIIDRRKSMFKLAQGEYVAPEKIENVYVRCPLIAQVFVHGNSLKASLVAIVVPDQDEVKNWARKNNLSNQEDFAALCKESKLLRAITESMQAIAKEAGLKGFEQARKIHLHPESFSVANGLLTPSFKLRRFDAAHYFEKEIQALYDRLD